jgi:hypothetical protein
MSVAELFDGAGDRKPGYDGISPINIRTTSPASPALGCLQRTRAVEDRRADGLQVIHRGVKLPARASHIVTMCRRGTDRALKVGHRSETTWRNTRSPNSLCLIKLNHTKIAVRGGAFSTPT